MNGNKKIHNQLINSSDVTHFHFYMNLDNTSTLLKNVYNSKLHIKEVRRYEFYN